jgi:type IV pilus assembly protein PilE
MRSHRLANTAAGFTLLELMIVVAIVTILATIAYPSYMQQVRQSRRTEARTAIMDMTSREERYFSTNGASYTAAAAGVGYNALPVVVGSGYYTLSVCSPACAPSAIATTPSYTVTATPVAGQSQALDTTCQSFSVDSTGKQFAFDNAGNNTTTTCWTQ